MYPTDYLKNNMKNKPIAKVAVIDYAGKSFLGLIMPCGEYRIPMMEVLTLFFDCCKRSFVELKQITGLNLRGEKVATELTEQTENKMKLRTLTLNELQLVAQKLADKGNQDARVFVATSETEDLDQAFREAHEWKRKHISAI